MGVFRYVLLEEISFSSDAAWKVDELTEDAGSYEVPVLSTTYYILVD